MSTTSSNAQSTNRKPIIIAVIGIVIFCCLCLCCATTIAVIINTNNSGGGGFSNYGPSDELLVSLVEEHIGANNPNTWDEFKPTNTYIIGKSQCESLSDTALGNGISEAWIVQYSYDVANSGDYRDDSALAVNQNGIWEIRRIPSCP